MKQVCLTQKLKPVKNDWWLTVAENLKYLNIDIEEKDIANIKKSTFKTLLTKKIRIVANEYLIGLRNKHTKSAKLES